MSTPGEPDREIQRPLLAGVRRPDGDSAERVDPSVFGPVDRAARSRETGAEGATLDAARTRPSAEVAVASRLDGAGEIAAAGGTRRQQSGVRSP